MPLGLDTPSTFGTVFLIIGPAYQAANATGPRCRIRGTACLVLGHHDALGLRDLQDCVCAAVAVGSGGSVPRAGLLGSLAAIALVLISFLPLLDIAAQPVAGMVALGLILATLTATLAVSA